MDYDDGYETRTDDIEIWKSVNLIGFFVRPKALGQHNSRIEIHHSVFMP